MGESPQKNMKISFTRTAAIDDNIEGINATTTETLALEGELDEVITTLDELGLLPDETPDDFIIGFGVL